MAGMQSPVRGVGAVPFLQSVPLQTMIMMDSGIGELAPNLPVAQALVKWILTMPIQPRFS